jgi:acyl carrier protein
VAPTTPLERGLADLWGQLLKLDEIGIEDDFYDLGGDSLLAAELVIEIKRRFGRELPLGVLTKEPTIAGLTRALGSEADPGAPVRCLIPVQTRGSRRPFFCVHGGAGMVGNFPRLAKLLGSDQPFYSLQWDGVDGSRGEQTIEGMARRYLREMREAQPTGPYILGGLCVGGVVAYEMARQLQVSGEKVALVALFDSPHLRSPAYQPATLAERWKRFRRRQAHYWLQSASIVGGFASAAFGKLGSKLKLSRGHANGQLVTAGPRAAAEPSQAASLDIKQRVGGRLGWALRRRGLGDLVATSCQLLRVRTPQEFRTEHGALTMIRAVTKYPYPEYDGELLYFSTGLDQGQMLGLPGAWTDDLLGWSVLAGQSGFEAHRIVSGHNEIVLQPETARILRARFDSLQSGD